MVGRTYSEYCRQAFGPFLAPGPKQAITPARRSDQSLGRNFFPVDVMP